MIYVTKLLNLLIWAEMTQTFPRDNFRFWSKEKWSPCSPDLNPMDFSVWTLLEKNTSCNPHKSVEELKNN